MRRDSRTGAGARGLAQRFTPPAAVRARHSQRLARLGGRARPTRCGSLRGLAPPYGRDGARPSQWGRDRLGGTPRPTRCGSPGGLAPPRLGGMSCGNSISARTLSFAAIIIYGKILERSHTDSGATSILSSQTIVPYSALAVLKKSTSFSRAQYGSAVRYSQLNIPVSPVSNRTLTLQLPHGTASVTKCSCSIMPTPFSEKAVRSLAE